MQKQGNKMTDCQKACPKITSRIRQFLTTGKFSDCSFLVGFKHPELVEAHKITLAMASPVFEAQFYGDIPLGNQPIEITDIEPSVFRTMLNYIYLDETPQFSSLDEARCLIHAAKKYLLHDLDSKCSAYLMLNVNAKNCLAALEIAIFFEISIIIKKCMAVVSLHTKEILNDPEFLNLKPEALLKIFQTTKTSCTELQFFLAFKKYVNKNNFKIPELLQTERLGRKDLSEDESFVIKAFGCIRFLTFTQENFIDYVHKSNLLSTEDEIIILIKLCPSGKDRDPMPSGFCTIDIKRVCSKCSNLQQSNYNIYSGNLCGYCECRK